MGQIVVPAASAIARRVTLGAEPPERVTSLSFIVVASVEIAAGVEIVAASTLLRPNENWTTATHIDELVEPAGAVVPGGQSLQPVSPPEENVL